MQLVLPFFILLLCHLVLPSNQDSIIFEDMMKNIVVAMEEANAPPIGWDSKRYCFSAKLDTNNVTRYDNGEKKHAFDIQFLDAHYNEYKDWARKAYLQEVRYLIDTFQVDKGVVTPYENIETIDWQNIKSEYKVCANDTHNASELGHQDFDTHIYLSRPYFSVDKNHIAIDYNKIGRAQWSSSTLFFHFVEGKLQLKSDFSPYFD